MAASFTFLFFFLHLSLFLLSYLALPFVVKEPTAPEPNPSCPPFHCGKFSNITYPFFNTNPGCGLWAINCEGGMKSTIKFEDQGRSYVVKEILYEESTLVIQDEEFYNQSDFCKFLYNFTMPPSHIQPLYLNAPYYTFVNCKNDHQPLFNDSYMGVYNYTGCEDRILYYWLEDPQNLHHLPPRQQSNCSVTRFPLSPSLLDPEDLSSPFEFGFVIQWNQTKECNQCHKGIGFCTHNPSIGDFEYCFRMHPVFRIRPTQPPMNTPPPRMSNSAEPNEEHLGGRSKYKKILIGISVGVAVFFSACVFLVFFHHKATYKPIFFWNKKSKDDHDIEEFLKNYGSLIPNRYQYSDLKKMTSSFKDKLGQGGYGGVFKGKFCDGRLVAVKVLTNSKCNGEEFMNEVASIGRTNHVNIVTLLGFCSEGSKRALIYEFMPNGSLEKFIYTEKPRETSPLEWKTLYEIAIGIGRGLEYLHRGCSTRIVHLDIKPHNILLDEDFVPKISDFGLAKICRPKESIISMMGARGTAGYIAPEVFCRNFGGVSYKSDVYSYGMMVLEMVGGRMNFKAKVENTSEAYFPDWIYRHLDLNGHLGLQGVTMREEEHIARKMIIVGLWCIQINPVDRPSTSRVVEMLEGSVESLSIPPKPFLSSPSRTSQDPSTASIS